ncbi:MAG: adenosylmethionine decarboxylase [Candidatus Dasytiphilus stammeri]
MHKIKLQGFNNLAKTLSFCIYDICYAKDIEDRKKYIDYINDRYNAIKLTNILNKTCSIIGANILNIASQEFEPQGASVTFLISEENNFGIKNLNKTKNIYFPKEILLHLDKSHICVHTYPENHPQSKLCTFRADIEVSTCGVISPLKALNYLIYQLQSDIVTIDYRVRGFTRDVHGIKHFIDHNISSIQNFLKNEIKLMYKIKDINLYQENIFHTRMMLKNFELKNYLFNTLPENLTTDECKTITKFIIREMQEIFYGYNNK